MKQPAKFIKTALCGLMLGTVALSAQADSYDDGLMAFAVGNFAEAGQQFMIAAEQGSSGAEHMLMRLLTEGKIHTTDLDRDTLKWTQKAAKYGIMAIPSMLVFKSGAPVGINDRDVSSSLRRTSVEVVGEENVKDLPFIMGSEDFYYFTQQRPGAMMRFGCASEEDGINHPLHSPDFDIHEDVLEVGVDVLYRAVENFFKVKE